VDWLAKFPSPLRVRPSSLAWLLLLLLIPLRDSYLGSPEAEYDRARQELLHGHLAESQREADRGYRRFGASNSEWGSRFQLLEAETMVGSGTYVSALRILAAQAGNLGDPDDKINALTLQGVAFAHLHRFSEASQVLAQSQSLCANAAYPACGGVLRAFGILAVEHGQRADAQQFFARSLAFARAHRDRDLETTALLNLGFISLQNEHYDEALDWSTAAYRAGLELGNENRVQGALGNIGWAYFELGDADRALDFFLDAENRAAKLGNFREQLKWLTTAGNVYQVQGDLNHASASYRRALDLAKAISSKEDIVNALVDIARGSIDAGRFEEAEGYILQLDPFVRANGNRLDALDVMLIQGRIAAAKHDREQAESIFRAVDHATSQTSRRLTAEHQLALLYESEGDISAADRMYRTTLNAFESAREQLKNEDSKLPFLANATGIYDDYIHFLVGHGKSDEALRLADQSRARTLAQGLGVMAKTSSPNTSPLRPGDVAKKTGATLLFYWLGAKQSYLWAINRNGTTIFELPPASEITPTVERYRKTLLGLSDAVESSNGDGLALYRMLVAPTNGLIQPDSSVVILSDGALSQLNFETLIVPGPTPHYWIEDATLTSAPSLSMLASARQPETSSPRLLLLGDAVSPNADYPELPMAATEMNQIQRHFASRNETVFAREKATAYSYLASAPQQFAYIHFVTHGVASRTDPLDSAIILSRSTAAEDSFKLHAREIIRHPIQARLVTISACYGSGTRSYAGEGLVGLSWAFLRAGAHNVIGALWEVSDESTPQLMGSLYQGIEEGKSPGVSLRQAKLSLLHSQGRFRKPFYWAPLQLYTGL
jgi:CHAT domain-containing protein/Tfp pilus assembly protein PilF